MTQQFPANNFRMVLRMRLHLNIQVYCSKYRAVNQLQ